MFLKKYLPILFVISIVVFTLIYHYPYVLGKMFPSAEDPGAGFHYKYRLGNHIKFPRYVFRASNWINGKKDVFNMLLLPDGKNNIYRWGYSSAGDITSQLFSKAIIFRPYGQGMAPPHSVEKVYSVFIELLYDKSINASKILNLLNVRYILQRNDFWYDFYGDIDSPSFIKARLKLQKGIELEEKFGEWDLYRVEPALPHIFSSSSPVVINGEIRDLYQLVTVNDFQIRPGILFLKLLTREQQDFIKRISQDLSYYQVIKRRNGVFKSFVSRSGRYEVLIKPYGKELQNITVKINNEDEQIRGPLLRNDGWMFLKNILLKKGINEISISASGAEIGSSIALRRYEPINGSKQKISFNKLNPTRYYVRAAGVEAPYFLIFSESFNPGWKAYYGRVTWWQALWRQPIPENRHLLINGYANAWYIDKPGNYEMTLYFWPQSLFYIGLIVSGLTFFGCVGYLAYDWRKRGVEL